MLWLADSYGTMPDFDFYPRAPGVEGTMSDEVGDSWDAPFIGTFTYILTAP